MIDQGELLDDLEGHSRGAYRNPDSPIDKRSQKLLNSVFEKLTSITYKYSGFCRDFLFEDKGCTFIAVFGALKRGEHDELAAVLASIDIQKALKNNFKMTSYR
jgi:hypothetical protein